jgi:hypothetical protein
MRTSLILLSLLCAIPAVAAPAGEEPLAPELKSAPPTPPPAAGPARQIGSVAAPAVLPGGTMAFYGQIGAPDVGAGYRQGFEAFELEARAMFNDLELSALAEVGVKFPAYRHGKVVVAPGLALGLQLNSGSRYFDKYNFGSFSLRPRASVATSILVTDTVQALVLFEVPWAMSLNVSGTQVTPLLGAGAEFHVGDALSLLVTAHGGLDAIKEPLGVTQVRPAWAIRLGIGYRMF